MEPLTNSNIKSYVDMYFRKESLPPIGTWDVSNVTDMSNLFKNKYGFNEDISNWDVSKVTDMSGMFSGCGKFNNGGHPLNWNVSNVESMNSMFYGCENFNQPLNWIVSNVEDMRNMFNGCKKFDQPLNWNVSKVEDMSNMFNECYLFNRPLNWNVSKVENMAFMFVMCKNFNQPLTLTWDDVSNVTDMSGMFIDCKKFNQPLNWNVSNVTNMAFMFQDCKDFNNGGHPLNWDVSNVENMNSMFINCTNFNQPLTWDGEDWVISRVQNMDDMFYDCINFTQDLSHWNLSNVETYKNMFLNCPCIKPVVSMPIALTNDTLREHVQNHVDDSESTPPIGAPIMVTSRTKNGEVGKFIGTYSPEQDQFVLRPLPGKRYVEQFPMFPNQSLGWEFALDFEEEKEAVDPNQIRVDIFGVDRMVFPNGYMDLHLDFDPGSVPDTFTWTLFKDTEVRTGDKRPSEIKTRVKADPTFLKLKKGNDGLTFEILMDLMNENGTWLEYVYYTCKTYDICLAAVRNTSDAIKFVPPYIIEENPIFYEIAIEDNPEMITEVPVTMLTKKMIHTALTKNPNIRYLPSMKTKLNRIPYEDAPIPPSLERQLSWTHTNQGTEPTCGRHAFSRVIIKNFFELILPLNSNRDQEKSATNF